MLLSPERKAMKGVCEQFSSEKGPPLVALREVGLQLLYCRIRCLKNKQPKTKIPII